MYVCKCTFYRTLKCVEDQCYDCCLPFRESEGRPHSEGKRMSMYAQYTLDAH